MIKKCGGLVGVVALVLLQKAFLGRKVGKALKRKMVNELEVCHAPKPTLGA